MPDIHCIPYVIKRATGNRIDLNPVMRLSYTDSIIVLKLGQLILVEETEAVTEVSISRFQQQKNLS